MSNNQNWGKLVQIAITHLEKSGSLTFEDSSLGKLRIRKTRKQHERKDRIETSRVSDNFVLRTEILGQDGLAPHIMDLYNPRILRLNGNTQPKLEEAFAKPPVARRIAATQTKKETDAAESLLSELKEKGLLRPVRFNMFEIVSATDGTLYIIIGIFYDLNDDRFMFRCVRSLNNPIEEPVLFFSSEIKKLNHEQSG